MAGGGCAIGRTFAGMLQETIAAVAADISAYDLGTTAQLDAFRIKYLGRKNSVIAEQRGAVENLAERLFNRVVVQW